MKKVQAIIIGGGSAGLSAAVTLKKNGIEDVLVIEKDEEPGGILEQCIHNGFGLQTFQEQLSGPAYAERFVRMAEELNVRILLNTTVTKLTADRVVEYVNSEEGAVQVQADAVILAVGCYERPRGGINITGTRPAGIYTAGQAQRYLNIDGYMVGKRVFILGSGDIGLIMARRMTLEGAKVIGVAELMPYSNGLPRNMKQCLEDFDIPLYLSHTVSKVFGKDRLEKIEMVAVDENRNPIAGSEQYFDVDTLLLSVGLIPENHLADHAGIRMDPSTKGPVVDDRYMTSEEGIFACGNGLHVHDLVDYVSLQAARAAEGAAAYLRNGSPKGTPLCIKNGNQVSYCVPSQFYPEDPAEKLTVYFRVRTPMDNQQLVIRSGDKVIRTLKKRKLLPSVMEEAVLLKKDMEGLTEDITVEITEVAS
ncbi:MAG: NAD(P)/FAD-dependent oxidoreductase [Oscillospiraceae bacterium]|nr:NAD(P)/FAD-dependent oxidoreductase [Oscillospiraceae bacterium]